MDHTEVGVVASFLIRLLEDRDAGRTRPLAEYQSAYPGFEAAIARAHAEVVAGAPIRTERTVGPYRLVRELGRGGQGEVWLAEDSRLGRKVALKLLRGWGSASEELVERFRREGEIASRLEHPGICPVYDAGVEDGVPYLAMRYVEGETLARKITRARGEGGGDSSGVGGTTRQDAFRAVGLVERVARAVHAAHEAGILHRDLKPGNVMVTPQGEPVVLDFGLAQELDGERSTLTRSGDVFGTPGYLSPERVSPGTARPDRRADVWSLGVTLYESLTLRRPFDEPTREALCEAIRSERPPDPRRLNPAVGRDLGIVLATALEKDRERRYQTALDLAEDLRRVRVREPIRARPVGLLVRLGRWVQREPALAAAVCGIVAVLVAGLVVSGKLLSRSRRETARANTNLEQAMDAVDRLLTRVAVEPDRLRDEPQMDPVRRALLEDALRFYERFLEQRPDDPFTRRQVAFARAQFSGILSRMGDLDRALSENRSAVAELEELHRASQEPRLGAYIARQYLFRAGWLTDAGRTAEKATARARAGSLARTLWERFPDEPACADALSRWWMQEGHEAVARGRWPEAQTALRHAIDLTEPLVEGTEGRVPEILPDACSTLGQVLSELGRFEEAEALQRRALALQERRLRLDPRSPYLRHSLGDDRKALAETLATQGRTAEARELFQTFRESREEIAREFPDQPRFCIDAALAPASQGIFLVRARQAAEGEPLLLRAVTSLEELVRREPDDPMRREALGRAYTYWAEALVALARNEESLVYRLRAADVLEGLLTPLPGYGRSWGLWLDNLVDFSKTARRLGRPREAAEALFRLLSPGERAIGGFPVQRYPRCFVVEGHAQLAVLWSTAGRTERAEREFLRALELFRPVVDQLPDLPEIRRQLGSILGDIATNLNVAGRPAEALGCVEEAIGHQSQVLARAPRDQVALNHLRRNHQQLASAWCALGRHVEAARSLDRLLERAGEDPEALFVAARTLARCVHVTEHDEELGPEDRRRMAGAYADRAVERLREAVRRGFRDQKRLRATPELKPLQDREDFRSLLESLAAR